MKKKLLIFHPYLATYRVDVYNRFTQDYDVKVILTGHPGEIAGVGYNLEKVHSQAKFDFKYYNNGHFYGRQQITTIYFKAIKDFKPDIVLCHEYGFNTLAAIALKPIYRYKLFLTCDDSLQMAANYSKKRKKLRNFVVTSIDGILVVSTKTKDFLEKIYPKSTCKFIYFPIIQNDDVLSQKINDARTIAELYSNEYNLKAKRVLLYVGRFDPVKNIPLLVNAYNKIKTPNDILVLVGDGQMKDSITKQISDLKMEDNVILTGALYAEDLYAWYYLADVFALASKKEAFGAVVNEALVAGCFCVVSDHAGAHTLIQNDVNGFVFENENETDLSSKLEISLLRTKKIVCKNSMLQTFESFYNELTNNFS